MQLIPISIKTIKSKKQSLLVPKKRGRILMTMSFLNSQLFSDKMESHQHLKVASTTISFIPKSQRGNHPRKRKLLTKVMYLITPLKLRSNNPSKISPYYTTTSKLKQKSKKALFNNST